MLQHALHKQADTIRTTESVCSAPHYDASSVMKLAAVICLLVSSCSSGVKRKSVIDDEPAEAPAAENPAQPVANGEIDPNAKGPFKRVFQIVDKQTAMQENANYVETVNTIDAGDYFSGVAQGAFAAASKVQTIGLQHFVNLHEAEHGNKPTLDDVKAYLKRNNLKLKGLYPYQVYAYDQASGKVSILEDRAEKAKRDGG